MVLALENIVRTAKLEPLFTTIMGIMSLEVGAVVGKTLSDGIAPIDVPILLASGFVASAVA
ncbi:MAG: hypothetical protein IH934_00620 [Nanoarchaeota archaeon]|nr:hypothetical protein [Nanoarchaeota archaeon]